MQLAQINIARMKAPIDSDIMSDFVANLDRINEIAESSDGFVWRLKDDSNNATEFRPFEDEMMLVNLSVWTDIESLFAFVYQSMHVEIFKRKKEWFDKMDRMHMAMWYIEPGQYPTEWDGKTRLEHYGEHGETPYAFTFKKRFSIADYKAYRAHHS